MTLLFCLTQYYHPLGNGQIPASKHGASRAQILWFLTVVVLAAMHYAVIPSRALPSTQYMIINHICYLKSPLSMGLVQSNEIHADHTELLRRGESGHYYRYSPRLEPLNSPIHLLRPTMH